MQAAAHHHAVMHSTGSITSKLNFQTELSKVQKVHKNSQKFTKLSKVQIPSVCKRTSSEQHLMQQVCLHLCCM
jgi:hypothetical protein